MSSTQHSLFFARSLRPAIVALLLGGASALVGCSSSSDDAPAVIAAPALGTGFFFDSPVEGLTVVSGETSGSSSSGGRFRFEFGTPTSFALGEITLGSTEGRALLTIVDLVPGALNELDPTVTNIARFLQTVDADQNSANGIQITPSMASATSGLAMNEATFSQSILDFENDIDVTNALVALLPQSLFGSPSLISTPVAQAHLRQTLLRIQAGVYEGEFEGDEDGTWKVVAAADGTVVGFGNLDSVGGRQGFFGLNGFVDSSGGIQFGSLSTGADFSGQILPDGSVSGEYDLPDFEATGGFSGNRNLPHVPFISQDALSQVAGFYFGSFEFGGQSGNFTLSVSLDGLLDFDFPFGNSALVISSVSEEVELGIDGVTDTIDTATGAIGFNGVISGTLLNEATGETGFFSGTLSKGV